jgi:hypothetical protein
MPLTVPPTYPDLLRAVFWDDFVTTTYNNRIWAVTGTGSITSLSEIGGRIRVRANAGLSYRFNLGDVGNFTVAGKAAMVWRGSMTPATAAGGLCHCGMQASTNPTTNYVRWIYEPNASANFRCSCVNGGSETIQSSGVAGDNLDHEFRIECSTGVVLFYLDGILRYTNSASNIPTGQLQPFAACTGSAAVVSDLNADWVWGIGDRV